MKRDLVVISIDRSMSYCPMRAKTMYCANIVWVYEQKNPVAKVYRSSILLRSMYLRILVEGVFGMSQ